MESINKDTQQLHDVALIAKICEYDHNAFALLYKKYYPRLSRFIVKITQNESYVDEIINDVMLTVWEKAASYNHHSLVSTWILGIAFNKARQTFRNENNPHEDSIEDFETNDLAFGIYDSELNQLELDNLLDNMLTALSPEQRTVVELTYFNGLAYSEIAELMNCPENTVKTRMYYARKILTTHLQYLKNGLIDV